MNPAAPQLVTITVSDTQRVSGLLQAPPAAGACYVLAHGAGAGMTHPFMAAIASGLAERDIATLRYQFPYMEQGSKRPDAPKLAHATVCLPSFSFRRMANKPDAANSAMALWLTIEDQWRRVADLERSLQKP
jgi:hypothetical protein